MPYKKFLMKYKKDIREGRDYVVADNKGFIFLGNPIKLLGDVEEVQIVPNYYLKRANEEQMGYIRNILSSSGDLYYQNKFESNQVFKNEMVHYETCSNPEDWNYWIIEHNGSQANHNLKLALLLSSCDLFTLFEKFAGIGATNYLSYSFHNFIEEYKWKHDIEKISQDNILEIQEIYTLLENFNNDKYIYIDKALDDYWQLRSIPRASPFYILGMFSILEALLVHNSKNVSITHQIKTKVNLLNNRFKYPINFEEIFNTTAKNETVISKLYDYRSDIAHGDFSDFKGDLQILGNINNVSNAIHSILKSTLKQALKEPQLISDLKKC